MKKYGVNWLLVFVALFLMTGVPHLWEESVKQCFRPPHVPWSIYDWVFRAFSSPLDWTLIAFFFTRFFAKRKEKALQTPEGEHVTADTSSSLIAAKSLPPRPLLISAYGAVSAVVGGVSLAAHLITGRLPAWEVVLFAIFVPLCAVTGGYLLLLRAWTSTLFPALRAVVSGETIKIHATSRTLQTESRVVTVTVPVPLEEGTAIAAESEVMTVGARRWTKGEPRR